MTLLEAIKHIAWADLEVIRDNHVWYRAYFCYTDTTGIKYVHDDTLLFRIPFEDLKGGTFNVHEIDNPRHFQRWIRKELELQVEEAAEIAKAKEEWKP